MSTPSAPLLIDATPLQSEHRLRGVGAYLRALLATDAMREAAPVAFASTLVPPGAPRPAELRVPAPADGGARPAGRVVALPRPHAPAQAYWLANEAALRLALARVRPRALFAPDFNGVVANPWGATVAVLHDLTPLKEEPAPGLSGRLSAWRWRAYFRKLRSAERVLVISESVRRDALAMLDLDPERLRVVHHGVDRERFRPARGEGRWADAPPYLLHVGACNPNKNVDRLLEAYARLPRPRPDLLFAGPWRAPDLERLERRRAELGLGPGVRHAGWVEDADLPGLYGNALAFVFPSLEEGFGMPVLEAMACGAPVLTSDRSSLPEAAGDAAALADPTDVGALAAALARLVGDADERARLRRAGLARAAAFTWEATARRTLEVIDEAVGDARAGLSPRRGAGGAARRAGGAAS